MRRFFEIGGMVAAAIMIAFGIASLVMSFNGRDTVVSSLKQEQITGTPDMTPAAITAEAKKSGLNLATTPIPTCSVAGKLVDSGARARCFAQYMRVHTLEATGGLVYAQMGRYQALPTAPKSATDGQGATSDPKYAVIDPKTKQPVSSTRRDIWVTETALTTALNTSYMADQISLFGVVVGITLLLSGIGFAILAIATLGTTVPGLRFLSKVAHKPAAPPTVPSV